jgi:hypothetical protein
MRKKALLKIVLSFYTGVVGPSGLDQVLICSYQQDEFQEFQGFTIAVKTLHYMYMFVRFTAFQAFSYF